MDKINPIEKRMLPEFFSAHKSSKTAELYLKYRNYMVHASRQQPDVYLTATACRRNLAGDACAILRVHEFLTHWGLINFHVPPHAMPPAIHSNYALQAVGSATSTGQYYSSSGGSNSTARDEQSPVAMLVAGQKECGRRVDVPLACEGCGVARQSDDLFFELTSEAKKKLTTSTAVGNASSATHGMNGTGGKAGEGQEMTVRGFALRPGSGICEECYIRGAFPEGYDVSDFVLMPTVTKNLSATASWTQEENDRLLTAVNSSTRANRTKGVREYEEDEESCDWNFVASKVGSKTAEECLLHFLEIPTLDTSVALDRGTRVGDMVESMRPFSAGAALTAPVLDLVSLVEQVDPIVAKAAAHAAIGAIKRLHTMPADIAILPSEASLASVKHEATASTAEVKVESAPTSSGPVTISDGSLSSLEDAAAAVASSAEEAGIRSTIKSEDTPALSDVAMEDVPLSNPTLESTTETVGPGKHDAASISKEMIAVTEEAARATTVALLATRAQQIADDIANGPVKDLVQQLVENQLRQIELKMQQLAVLEQTVCAEKEQLAKEKYELYVDRLAFSREKMNGRLA
uniref:SWIRM domain-containing protein n=1 Tax=Peronospora matthiolae TaxID=2874970 RepID=A0AAV1USP1_9STRA